VEKAILNSRIMKRIFIVLLVLCMLFVLLAIRPLIRIVSN